MLDPMLQFVIDITNRGSEFGQRYDDGARTVILQIQQQGFFQTNSSARLAHRFLADPPATLSEHEIVAAKLIVQQSGLSLTDAAMYFRGVCHTEDRLRDYVRD